MSHIERLKTIWTNIYDPREDVKTVIEEFFHPDYEQCINGIIMNRTQYIDHVIAQKKTMVVNNIEYIQHIENGDNLFVIYYPKAKNQKGSAIEAEVISYFQFKDKQILKTHGQVRLIKGDFADVDMENH